MSLQVVDLATTPLQAWRNGGGVTQELLAWPDANRWDLRISVARIERDGPFSAFPGVQRWFTVLRGAGVRLQLQTRVVPLRSDTGPLCFDGALAPGCELVDGPTEDLNMMLRCEAGQGAMQPVDADLPWSCDAAWRGVFCLDGAELIREGLGAMALPPGSLAWSDDAAHQRWRLQAQGKPARAWWMYFQPQAQAKPTAA